MYDPRLSATGCVRFAVLLLSTALLALPGPVDEAACSSARHVDSDAMKLQDRTSLVQAILLLSRSSRSALSPGEHTDVQRLGMADPEGRRAIARLAGPATFAGPDAMAAQSLASTADVQMQTPTGWAWADSLHTVKVAGTPSGAKGMVAAAVPEEHWVTLASGLKIFDLVNGTGNAPSKGQRVWVHYVANLDDGTEFDNSYTSGEPLEDVIGDGSLVAGFDEGISTMRMGGKRKLIIPPSLGYGNKAPAGSPIPNNATLHFQCEVVGIEPKVSQQDYMGWPMDGNGE